MANLEDCDAGLCSQFYLTDQPSLSVNVALCSSFGVLVLLAAARALRNHGLLFAASLITGLLLEVLGYVGGILLSTSPYRQAPFVLFLLGTILGPNFICCAVFLCLPNIIHVYGSNFRTWTPPWYHGVFAALIGTSFVLELVGSALLTMLIDDSKVVLGIQLVAIGLAVLIAALAIFVAHATLLALALRTRQHGLGYEYASLYNSKKFKSLLFGLGAATFLLILRSTFRLITVVGRSTGQDSPNEVLFLVLEGIVVLLAAMLLLVFYPPQTLDKTWFSFTAPDGPLSTITITNAMASQHYGSSGYSYGLSAPSQPVYNAPYMTGRILPGPPSHPPPPRPPPPPPPLSRPLPRMMTMTAVQRSPVCSDHQNIESGTGNASPVNYSRKHSVSSGGQPSPPPASVMPQTGGGGQPGRRNMVTSESLW